VRLEDGTELQVYVNWFNENGPLRPGDEVEYDVPEPGKPLKRNFRRAPKEPVIE
jgi:hypothetical protein